MYTDPIQLFNKWFSEECKLTKVRIPGACCLSTLGLDNYPNSRFVSLKETLDDRFIVTGNLNSRKGIEISQSNKVSLTFWWTETERQIRIQGEAKKIPDKLADHYFSERNRDSRIVSIVSEQGQELKNINLLIEKYSEINLKAADEDLVRPENWGGYSIKPIRIEFLEFKSTRFHERNLYQLLDDKWEIKQLQP